MSCVLRCDGAFTGLLVGSAATVKAVDVPSRTVDSHNTKMPHILCHGSKMHLVQSTGSITGVLVCSALPCVSGPLFGRESVCEFRVCEAELPALLVLLLTGSTVCVVASTRGP